MKYMHTYPGEKKRRVLPQEIRAWVRKTYNAELVDGFLEIIENKAKECSGRAATSLENKDHHTWYLELSSGGHLLWKTEEVPVDLQAKDIVFIFPMGLGNGSPLPQPTGQFDLYCNDKMVVSFRVVKHSWTWQGNNGAMFHFSANRIESAAPNSSIYLDKYLTNESFASFGFGFLRIPSNLVTPGKAAILKVVPVSEVQSTRWFQLVGVPHCIDNQGVDIYRGILGLYENTHSGISGYKVFFGDIHTHSGVSYDKPGGCGIGTREDNYRYARGPGGLDIYSLTDHERQITKEGISDYLNLADKFNENGRFVALPGYEHTNQFYGHRNVYFDGSGGTVIPCYRNWDREKPLAETSITPEELWDSLRKLKVKAITVPHHSSAVWHPLTWDFYDSEFDRLAEVYSGWGSSEYYGDYPRGVSDRFRGLSVRDALNRGYRLGLIASSDGHDGHPGNTQSPLIKHHHIFHPLGSGWIAVLASNLTRQEVFDAMYKRRCYGTTGVPIVLNFTINGHIMGSELPKFNPGEAPILNVICQGSNGIDHIRIIKNSVVVKTIPWHGEWECDIKWKDVDFDPGRPNYYYIRVVQVDYESAWSSPIWIG